MILHSRVIRCAFRGILFSLLVSPCPAIGQQTQIGWDDFRLPYAVAGEADRHIPPNNVLLGEQRHTLRFESSRDWWRFELWVPEGDFGSSITQFSAQNRDQSLHYSGPSRQGYIDDAFDRTGFASGEMMCSPIGAVRLLLRAYASQLPVERTDLNQSRSRFTWHEPATRSRFELLIDTTAGTVLEAQRGEGENATRFMYLDWRSVGGDRLHPFRIESIIGVEGAVTSYKDIVQLTELRPLPADAVPSPYKLPPDAVIVNRLTGTAAMVSGEPVVIDEQRANPTTHRLAVLSTRNILITIVIVACAAAGLVTVLKRRGAM